jgi:hypothetical protein
MAAKMKMPHTAAIVPQVGSMRARPARAVIIATLPMRRTSAVAIIQNPDAT